MKIRRALAVVLIVGGGLAGGGAGCGFGLADDTGQPIPGQYWPWVCADGGAPGDAACPQTDAGARPDADGAVGVDAAAGD